MNQGIKTFNVQLEIYLLKKIPVFPTINNDVLRVILTHNKTNSACSVPGLTFPFVNTQA